MATTAPNAAKPTDANTIQAQIDLQVSKARDLVASWLPARRRSATEDSDDDDEELFKPAPPRHILSLLHTNAAHTHTHTHAVPADLSSPRTKRLGVGAAVPAEFRARGAGADTLRRNLLGLAGRKPTRPMPAAEKSPAARKTRPVQDESDEETGRSALGGPCSKRRRTSADPSRKPARVSAIVAVKTRDKMKVGEQEVEVVAEVEGGLKVEVQSETNSEGEDKEVKPKLTGDGDTPAISASSLAASASDTSSAALNPSSKKSKKKNKRRADGTASEA